VFCPDENASNRLDAIYEVSKKLWMADYLPEDADGGQLSTDGRVLEMLSEHTLEGWLEGYLLTGRHGFFSTYEAFAHVIDSMFNMHAKWLARAASRRGARRSRPWTCSLHRLARDHNGFTIGIRVSSTWSQQDRTCVASPAARRERCSAWPTTACTLSATSTSSSATSRNTCNTSTWKTPSRIAPRA
jgi:hypothetical protein